MSHGLLTPPYSYIECFDAAGNFAAERYAYATLLQSSQASDPENAESIGYKHSEAPTILEVTELIGSGASGIVYRAECQQHSFALKWPISTDAEQQMLATEAVEQEAAIYATYLSHLFGSAVPAFHGLYSSGSRIVLVLDYLGESLSSFDDLSDLQR